MTNIKAYLNRATGKTCQYWMDWIGNTIAQYSKPMKGSVHQTTESNLWLRVRKHFKKSV